MLNKRRIILIADDELNIRLLVSSMLDKDYVVLVASDGQEAVNIAQSQKPDLILMDIMMPNMDGYSACYVVKKDKATATIPVVMISAVGQELNKKFASQMGADGYITKPFQLQDLQDTINKFL